MPADKYKRLWWRKQMDIDLVDFMFTKRFVWDHNHPEFLDNELKQKAYKEFALKYKNDLTANLVRDRWTNIRSVFRNNLRKIMWHKKVTGKDYTPVWHLWEACTYLIDSKRRKRNRVEADSPVIHNSDLNILNENSDEELPYESSNETSSSNGSICTEEPLQPLKVDTFNNDNKVELENDNLIISCKKALANLSNLLSPIKLQSVDCDRHSDFQYIGKFVSERLCKMKMFDAECAAQEIINVLVLYNEFNPNNPNVLHTSKI